MENYIEEKLTAKNLTPTAMRLLVFEYLHHQAYAVSLTEIEHGLAPSDRVTIYRTVKTFEQNGLVHVITDGSGVQKYALCNDCSAEGHYDLHVHFTCAVCKETFCLPKSEIPEIKLPQGFQPEAVQLTVRGICDRCAR